LPKSSPCKTMPLVFMTRGEREARSSMFYPGALRIADNTGVEQLDQHCAVSRIYPFGWQGASATVVNMKSPTRFEVGANTRVVQVSRGVLHLESVP